MEETATTLSNFREVQSCVFLHCTSSKGQVSIDLRAFNGYRERSDNCMVHTGCCTLFSKFPCPKVVWAWSCQYAILVFGNIPRWYSLWELLSYFVVTLTPCRSYPMEWSGQVCFPNLLCTFQREALIWVPVEVVVGRIDPGGRVSACICRTL